MPVVARIVCSIMVQVFHLASMPDGVFEFEDMMGNDVIAAADIAIKLRISNPETGRDHVYLETLGGGLGVRVNSNGKDGVPVNITIASNLPVDSIEMEYPLRALEYSLVNDSGSAGIPAVQGFRQCRSGIAVAGDCGGL